MSTLPSPLCQNGAFKKAKSKPRPPSLTFLPESLTLEVTECKSPQEGRESLLGLLALEMSYSPNSVIKQYVYPALFGGTVGVHGGKLMGGSH